MEQITQQKIENKIYSIRGLQVMLDSDLAELYQVDVKAFNQAVKRNIDRFPQRFRFQLEENEYNFLRSQSVTLKVGRGKHRKYLPYVFTEQGVAMLSSILKSQVAVQVSIQIMDAFFAMRKFLLQNASIFQRLDQLEIKMLQADEKFEKVFSAMEAGQIKPDKGIFFDGQIFDAYSFVADLIKGAEASIVIIDNYIDENVLTLLSKRKSFVTCTILTKTISKQLQLDIDKHNAQYPPIVVKNFTQCHDRFLLIDKKELYHFGASLKDLGKKWFAFSKMEGMAELILKNI